jgi:hypothetical protein
MNASDKVAMGGVGGAGAGGAGGDMGSQAEEYVGSDGNTGGGTFDTDLRFKRTMGLAFLSAGMLAVGYVVYKARNAKKQGDAVGPQGKDPNKPGAMPKV